MARIGRTLGACAAAVMALAAVLAPASAPAQNTADSSSAPTIAAVGDMVCSGGPWKESPGRAAKYGNCYARPVSNLVVNGNYDALLALGDLQYLHGAIDKFRTYYDRTYGRAKDMTYPVPGNHEYYTKNARGYYHYFGNRAHPPNGWYSFDLGDWHIIGLNAQACKGTTWNLQTHWSTIPHWGCKPGDPQYEWLKRDLAAHPNSQYPCTMAMYHQPLFKWSYWPIRKTHRVQRPLWRLLMRAGADVVLNGHWHNYQRFAPLNTRGQPSDKGMAEFIVGTGGDTYSPLPKKGTWTWQPKPAGLVTAQGSSYGILQMTLQPDGYSFKWITAPGQPAFSDSGTATCH